MTEPSCTLFPEDEWSPVDVRPHDILNPALFNVLNDPGRIVGAADAPDLTIGEILECAKNAKAIYQTVDFQSVDGWTSLIGHAPTHDDPVQFNLSRKGQTLYLTIRGTANISDVLADATWHFVTGHQEVGDPRDVIKIAVAANTYALQILRIVNDEISRHTDATRLVVTGHSLGGAVAQLVALHLIAPVAKPFVCRGDLDVQAFVFASPMCHYVPQGSPGVAPGGAIDDWLGRCTNVIRCGDVVPLMPRMASNKILIGRVIYQASHVTVRCALSALASVTAMDVTSFGAALGTRATTSCPNLNMYSAGRSNIILCRSPDGVSVVVQSGPAAVENLATWDGWAQLPIDNHVGEHAMKNYLKDIQEVHANDTDPSNPKMFVLQDPPGCVPMGNRIVARFLFLGRMFWKPYSFVTSLFA